MDEFNPYQTPRAQITELEQKPSRPLSQTTYRWAHFAYSTLFLLALLLYIASGRKPMSGWFIAALFFMGLPLFNLGTTLSPKSLRKLLMGFSALICLLACASTVTILLLSKTPPMPVLGITTINCLSMLWTYQQLRR